MNELIFEGKEDKFKLKCEENHSDFTVNEISTRIIKGKEIKCNVCDSRGFVYNDGGIYKLVDNDENINLEVW